MPKPNMRRSGDGSVSGREKGRRTPPALSAAEKLEAVYGILLRTYGEQRCFLNHETPFQLLVATILSAQCTDRKVNSVTPALFRRYPDAGALAGADRKELESLIRVCGFYRAKAGSLTGAAQRIVRDFGGKVPENMEDLTSLPGVGRKTANVLLGDAFGVPGLPVDTHVKRISNLLGVVSSEDPARIEEILCSGLPPEKWAQFSHLMIVHGRTRCRARRPDCANCELASLCEKGKAEGGGGERRP